MGLLQGSRSDRTAQAFLDQGLGCIGVAAIQQNKPSGCELYCTSSGTCLSDNLFLLRKMDWTSSRRSVGDSNNRGAVIVRPLDTEDWLAKIPTDAKLHHLKLVIHQ